MKKLSIILSAILCIVYIVIFAIYAPQIVKLHNDNEFFIPFIAGVLSVVIFAVMLIVYKIKHFDEKLFFIPMFIFLSALLTCIIGFATPCEYCDVSF